jgi:protocatechuate 3,4-dioxygenase beta subunit
MEHDDRPVGRLMGRREVLTALGAAGAALLAGFSPRPGRAAGAASPAPASCLVTPEQMEGPYFVDERLNRSDIRSDPADGSIKAGLPIKLRLRVLSVSRGGCSPVAGAAVDIWHCDAAGVYSDARDPGFNTIGKKFLRGYQRTDAEGNVAFTTIYPGWYEGRTVHIHFKVRAAARSGRNYEFTSQFYFEDSITDRIHALSPYAARGPRGVRNAGDGIFRDRGGWLILPLAESSAGYTARFDVGLHLG